jgi:hypothetical protein
MTKTNDALSDALGIETNITKQEILEPLSHIESSSQNDNEEDFELTRKTMKRMVDKGISAVDDLYELAKSSEHPRTFEVLAGLIKTTSDVSKDLYKLQHMKKELKEINNKTSKSDGDITVEKAVFIGTTADLLKRIKEEKQ